MLSLCLTSYSIGKDLPETNGGSFLLSIILALKNKINSNIQKNYLQMKTMNGTQLILPCNINLGLQVFPCSHAAPPCGRKMITTRIQKTHPAVF